MLYDITRPFAKIALGVYFRKIYIANADVLPKDKPIILAANHPTAFIEPCILACWLDKPLSFIARGDLYKNNLLLRKLYDWYRMTPIFRREDTGYSNLTSNYATFERCFNILKKNKTLMILAEGLTLHEKRMRPMRKGTARIVFSALENVGDLDIYLVPVGINYTDSDSFRSVAMIEFAEPIRCSEYNDLYNENPAKAIKELTSEMGRRLKEKIVHIDKEEDEVLVEAILNILENDTEMTFFPVSSNDSSLFNRQKKVSEKINQASPDEKLALKSKIDAYYLQLSKLRISDFGLVNKKSFTFWGTLFIILGAIPAIIGRILNILPIWIGNLISKKISPSIEFRAATAIVFSSFMYIFYGIALYATGFSMGFGWKTFILLALPLLGLFYIHYVGFMKKWVSARKASKLNNEQYSQLIQMREVIKKTVL